MMTPSRASWEAPNRGRWPRRSRSELLHEGARSFRNHANIADVVPRRWAQRCTRPHGTSSASAGKTMKRILVALDGSPRAPAVLAAAVSRARAQGGQLVLLRTVVLPPDVPHD